MRLSRQTFLLTKPVYIASTMSLAGPYEAKGNFKDFFDYVMEDDEFNEKSHELAEIKMQKYVVSKLLMKNNLEYKDIDLYLGGDLINQLTVTSFSAKETNIPYFGVYAACATFAESLIVGCNMLLNMDRVLCITSSHFATAERQYRFPLELGTQPTPASQWTITGSGALILDKTSTNCPKIVAYTIGKIVDLECTDVNNMGMAMAPGAADTIEQHLISRNQSEKDYDLIITGDLGRLGRDTLDYLLKEKNIVATNIINDCGAMIFNKKQKRGQGGSGAGCCSLVFCSYLYKLLLSKEMHRILFVPTGALLSKDSPLQGDTIPGIAHAIEIEV